ncbi:MAG TPA: GNAT family N-acetyltransferase [Gaiellaceae bacterium]
MIETERLLLRPPEPGDEESIYRWVSDPDVMRWLSGNPGTREDAVERVRRYREAWDVDGFGHFTVVQRETGEPVGRVGLLVWNPETWETGLRAEIGDKAEIELGWIIESAAWGNGYATEAAGAVRDWALREVQPRRLISLIAPENIRSQRVATKIGEMYRHDVNLHMGLTVGLWQLD